MQRVPIEFKVPPSTAADTSLDARLAQHGAAQRDDAHPFKPSPPAGTDAKHTQRAAREDNERDPLRARDSIKSEASDAKHAERESRAGRSEPAARHPQRESKYDLDRAKRDAERARDEQSSKGDIRHKDSDRDKRHSTSSKRHSLTRSVIKCPDPVAKAAQCNSHSTPCRASAIIVMLQQSCISGACHMHQQLDLFVSCPVSGHASKHTISLAVTELNTSASRIEKFRIILCMLW